MSKLLRCASSSASMVLIREFTIEGELGDATPIEGMQQRTFDIEVFKDLVLLLLCIRTWRPSLCLGRREHGKKLCCYEFASGDANLHHGTTVFLRSKCYISTPTTHSVFNRVHGFPNHVARCRGLVARLSAQHRTPCRGIGNIKLDRRENNTRREFVVPKMILTSLKTTVQDKTRFDNRKR